EKAKQDDLIDIIEQSSIAKKIILKRNRNYGCPKNHIDSKRFAFEWCGFSKVVVMEEDIVITPSYFTFMQNFYDWAHAHHENVGAVQSWNHQCFSSRAVKQKQLDLIRQNPTYYIFVTY